MAYALFANAKMLYTGLMNSVSLQQTQRSNEQYNLATGQLSLQSEITDLNIQQSDELSVQYELLNSLKQEDCADEEEYKSERQKINDEIAKIKNDYEGKVEELNLETYQISIKENAIEMEVKRLDTKITSLQKQLDQIQEAEGSGIDRSTPKFKGVG